MRRITDTFLDNLETIVPLAGKTVLEVGCGTGYYSEQIARRCRVLTAIDPDRRKLEVAERLGVPHTKFFPVSIVSSGLMSAHFDTVIFTLPFHHLPVPAMSRAIGEAVRVAKPDGRIVVLEPGRKGSFFEAEIRFDARDGDEREAKAATQKALHQHRQLTLPIWLEDETAFRFDDTQDFIASMCPKKNLHELEVFLRMHNYMLVAQRHIGIFCPRP